MCRRETIPANPAFPEGEISNKWTLALCVAIKRTTHMDGRFIVMLKGLFSLGMLDPTPLIGDASVLRRLVVQILRSELRARCVGTGTRVYEQIRTECSQGVCTVRWVIRVAWQKHKNTKSFSSQGTIRLILHSGYSMDPSFLVSSPFWLSPIRLFVCCIGKEDHFAGKEVTTRSKVSYVLLFFLWLLQHIHWPSTFHFLFQAGQMDWFAIKKLFWGHMVWSWWVCATKGKLLCCLSSFCSGGPPLSHACLFLLQVTSCTQKTVFMKRGIKMLLQVLSGLSHHAVHALGTHWKSSTIVIHGVGFPF